MEREVLLHVQPVGENEHEGNAEFVIVQSFQLFFPRRREKETAS